MLKKTLDDYYPLEFNRQHFDLDFMMDMVVKEQMEAKFGVYLEINDENLLNIKNMPWLDIGTLPETYAADKSEPFQVFVTPYSTMPNSLIVEFSDWSDDYPSSFVQTCYPQFGFQDRGVTLNDLLDTMHNCNLLVKPYRGRWTRTERLKNIGLGIGALIVFSLAILIGVLVENFVYTIFIVVMYIVMGFLGSFALRYMNSSVFRET